MKNHIAKTLERMDTDHFISFLINGIELNKRREKQPHNERLSETSRIVFDRLESIYTKPDELTEATNEVSEVICAYQEIYLEIGMKIGAKLFYNLFVAEE